MPEFKQLSRSVKGLTVLVTGAASGMGRATARVFAAEGANVAVTDVSADGAKTVADEIIAAGGRAKAWRLDVADAKAIDNVVGEVAAHFGSLDIIVNNAGISVRVAIDDPAYDEAWSKALAKPSSIPMVSDGQNGVLAPMDNDLSAMLNSDGSQQWATGSFGPIERAVVSQLGVLYIASQGSIYAVK